MQFRKIQEDPKITSDDKLSYMISLHCQVVVNSEERSSVNDNIAHKSKEQIRVVDQILSCYTNGYVFFCRR